MIFFMNKKLFILKGSIELYLNRVARFIREFIQNFNNPMSQEVINYLTNADEFVGMPDSQNTRSCYAIVNGKLVLNIW